MNMPRGRWVIFGSVILVSMTISTLLMPSREEMRELEEQQRKARLERLGRTQQSAKDTN
jgi:short subunit fatty acids transporter